VKPFPSKDSHQLRGGDNPANKQKKPGGFRPGVAHVWLDSRTLKMNDRRLQSRSVCRKALSLSGLCDTR